MTCDEATIYYYDYLQGDAVIPEAISAHIEQCEHCRGEIELLRQMFACEEQDKHSLAAEFMGLHYELAERWVSCEDVRPLLPSLLMVDFSVNNATPVTAHLEHCAACQRDLEAIAEQTLNRGQLLRLSRCLAGTDEASQEDSAVERLLWWIKARGGSDVLTRMTLTDKPEGATEGTWLSDAYTVDVKRRAQTAAVRPIRRRMAVPAFVTTGIAAAILFVVMLIVPSEKAQALDLSQVYQGIETVQNVHIRFLLEDMQEVQSIWISENLQARLFRQQGKTVFWDERSGEILKKDGEATELLSHFDHADRLERPWGLMPFQHLSELPADKEWTYIEDAEVKGIAVQVYELTWSDMGVCRTWRGYLDIQTHLPYRIEWIEKVGDDSSITPLVTEVRYPTDEECGAVFRQAGFRLSHYGVHADLFVMTP